MATLDPSRLAQNPDELFDVVRGDGVPLGSTKTRAAVHQDGDWHRAVHVWVYGVRASRPFILFQRRGRFKDTRAGKLDPTVAGHYAAGESLDDVLREVEEEIGVAAEQQAMRHVGVRVCASEGQPGILDRELQDVFLWRRDDPLEDYLPNPAELDALVEIGLDDLLKHYAGTLDTLVGSSRDASTGAVSSITLGPEELPLRIDRYVYRVAIAVSSVLRGDEHVAV